MSPYNFLLPLLGFFMAVYLIGNLVFSFIYYKYDFENNEIISEIENNLNTELISSLELKNECLYNEKSLILGKWDGTVEGCYCDNKIYRRKCTNEEKNNGCETIKPKESINYTKIKSGYMCIQTLENKYIDFVKKNQVKNKNEICPSQYQNCGIIDTAGNILCIENGKKCPIKINNINIENDDFHPFGYNTNFLEDDKLLGILKLSQYIPCSYPNERNWTYYYELESTSKKCSKKVNGELNDYNYKYILNTTKYELYKDNNIIDDLPFYNEDIIKNEKVFIYGRAIMGFDKEKIKKYSHDELISYQKFSNNTNIALKVFSYIFLLEIVVFLIVLIRECLKPNSDDDLYIDRALITLLVFAFFVIIITLAEFIINIIILVYSNKIKGMIDIRGLDDFSNDLVNKIIKKVLFNFYFSLILLCILGLIIIILIIMLLISFGLFDRFSYDF